MRPSGDLKVGYSRRGLVSKATVVSRGVVHQMTLDTGTARARAFAYAQFAVNGSVYRKEIHHEERIKGKNA